MTPEQEGVVIPPQIFSNYELLPDRRDNTSPIPTSARLLHRGRRTTLRPRDAGRRNSRTDRGSQRPRRNFTGPLLSPRKAARRPWRRRPMVVKAVFLVEGQLARPRRRPVVEARGRRVGRQREDLLRRRPRAERAASWPAVSQGNAPTWARTRRSRRSNARSRPRGFRGNARVHSGKRVSAESTSSAPGVGLTIAEMAMNLEAGRRLLWTAAWVKDHPEAIEDGSVQNFGRKHGDSLHRKPWFSGSRNRRSSSRRHGHRAGMPIARIRARRAIQKHILVPVPVAVQDHRTAGSATSGRCRLSWA